ncbi:hypothetical protein ACFQL0_14640 [Haloplanus litoreus]|uniref:hypothetical protein n=1 Tax=Haloplanus litoreus TaxID=767515 RepID=UPI00362457C2
MSRDVSRRSPAGTQDGDDTADGNGGGARLAHTRRALLRGVGAATAAGGALSTGTKRGVTTLTPVGVAGAESTPETAWTRTYGADDDREAWDVVERPDGDYLVVGRRAPSDGSRRPGGWQRSTPPEPSSGSAASRSSN